MVNQARTWNRTPSLNTGRTKLDLSHERRLTADMFYLYPILVEDCIPGDHWKIGNEIVCRLQPMVAPLMHEINIYVHYYAIPKRILWEDWEDYIFGGVDGKFNATIPTVNFTTTATGNWTAPTILPGGLLDNLYNAAMYQNATNVWHFPYRYPDALYLRAYNMILNEYYRSEDFQNEFDLDEAGFVGQTRYNTAGLGVRSWAKDYFTTAMPSTQRGTPLSIPLVVGSTTSPFTWNRLDNGTIVGSEVRANQAGGSGVTGSTISNVPYTAGVGNPYTGAVRLNLSTENIGTFNVTDLRWIVQAQLWMELAQRGGVRYTEGLRAFFGVSPRDERLDRPEYIGGTKTPIIISEVLQTSVPAQTGTAGTNTNGTTPLGTMAGHGISADKSFVTSYYVKEHCIILGLLSIMPKPLYLQGQERFFHRKNKYEHYWPQFRNLSEQGIDRSELAGNLYGTATLPQSELDRTNSSSYINPKFGYNGRYDEYRYRRSTIHGEFKNTLNYWHMARDFSTNPYLNESFLYPTTQEMQTLKRPFAVRTVNEFLLSIGNRLHVTRPLTWMSNPGLVDHA